jgi:methyltransferase domain protein
MNVNEKTSVAKDASDVIESLKNSYNELVYPSKSFGVTSVNSLEAKAKLWGLNPVPAKEARVLELGCSMGGNIIGQAVYHPEASYVGVDLSGSQIEIGNEIIEAIEFNNVKLVEQDILKIDKDFGIFDYIIVHGIWSWVPDVVKDKILEICNVNLSERGVAYISYNVYPGWHRLNQVREMMMFATQNDQGMDLLERTEKGISFVYHMNELIKESKDIVPTLEWKTNSFDSALEHKTYYIAHEYLEPINDPVYVSDFIKRAKNYNMVYVADTDFQLSAITWMKQERRKLIDTISGGDWNTKEQILDFYYDTQFRRSLLCHESQAHLLRHNEEFLIETLDSLYFGMVNKGKELKDADNAIEQAIVNQCRKGEFFNVADYKVELERLQNGAEYNEIELYSMLIRFLLCGFIVPVTEKKEITTFQEGVSTVPKEMAKYVQTVVDRGGHKFINISDLYNDSITGFNSAHVLMMKELETPKTLEELYKVADEILKVDETKPSGEVAPLKGRTVVDSTLDDLGKLGFLRNH